MPSAKEIKIYAKEHDVPNAEARKILIEREDAAPALPTTSDETASDKQIRELARDVGTIALGLVVEKRGSGKAAKALPKLKKNSPFFRIDVSLAEIEQLAETARLAMPGVTPDDFAYILGDGLMEEAHLQNGEQFAAALCGYFVSTEGYQHMKEHSDDPDAKGAIIRVIPYKDGYAIRSDDYIRSYEDVDQSFEKMKIQ